MTEKKEINLTFDLPKDQSSIIKVIGVGGGGSNAVNHMFRQGIRGVEFIVCNTDAQALDASPVPSRIQLGYTLTEGRGAGSNPEKGKNAAIENIDELKTILGKGTKMVFVTAGMGGGTGTGAAPVIAAAAKEMGILTVGIVTIPFMMEGNRRKQQAEDGLNELRKAVDTLLVISNDKLREICGNMALSAAFAQADNVLTIAAKGIAEIITVAGYINVDFADVQTVMTNGGSAIMGSATAEGENRAMRAVELALSSPLLNDNRITGAKHILINITGGSKEVLMDEMSDIINYVQDEAGKTANVIFGTGHDETLGEKISVTLIATGFDNKEQNLERVINQLEPTKANESKVSPEMVKNFDDKFVNTPPVQTESKVLPMPKADPDESLLIRDKVSGNPYLDGITLKQIPENQLQEESISDDEDNLRRSKERLENLKSLGGKLRSPASVSDMESLPAFRRKGVKLETINHSSETTQSRYVLSENDDKKIEIRQGNTYLHDNVD
jgi:cell division protein FtsZ